ncbi:MAG: peptidoglycan bridge formation glycyltransferase FemA/FemB family protein [Bacteroidales bacterium]|nr:peptidoglycan bridge formation glycyltransferase FemA/FemB family protein [Bacteroidales bacterium]
MPINNNRSQRFFYLLLMLFDVKRKITHELFKTPIVQQTAFWSIVKQKVGQQSIALNFKTWKSSIYSNVISDSAITSDILVILHPVNQHDFIAYIPYGPELDPENEFRGIFLEELSECIRPFLPKNCFMIRYDLCWDVFWANDPAFFDSDGNCIENPSVKAQEVRFNINTHYWNLQKSESNLLPTHTLYLNLQPNSETILKKMKPKTRYNIRLSHRKGVTVRTANLNDLPVWRHLYTETAIRNGIQLNNLNYFEAILSTNADESKSPAEVIYLIAEVEKKPLAAMFLVVSGHRGSYLYGASSGNSRNFMASYALQWEAINIAKKRGCIEYDMFGIAPNNNSSHPLYGLYKFKTGFGGEMFHSLGCWDYPFDQKKYTLYKSTELTSQGFHIN